jgi:hypothetical protein
MDPVIFIFIIKITQIDTTGTGEISFADFLNFVNHHQKDKKNDLFEKREDLNENEGIDGDGIEELGVLWLYLRLNLCDSNNGVTAINSEETTGLDRLMQELTVCVDDHQDKSDSNANGNICAQYVFLGLFVKSAVRSYLNTAQISLILNAFGVEDDMLNIHAANFMKWLSGEGVDNSDSPDSNPADNASESVQSTKREEKVSISINDNIQHIASDVLLLRKETSNSSLSRRSGENPPPSSKPTSLRSLVELPISKTKSEILILNNEEFLAVVDNGKEPIKPDNEELIPDKEEPMLPYECRDLMITSLVVEGVALTKRILKQLQIIVTIHGESYFASVSPAKERGTDRVTFAVSWKVIRVTEESFRSQDVATINLTASIEEDDSQLDVFTTTPLVRFMTVANSPFEVSLDLPLDSDDSVAANEDKNVKITLIGVSRMCAADLLKVKFEPFQEDEYDFSSPVNFSSTSIDNDFFPSPITKGVSSLFPLAEEVNNYKDSNDIIDDDKDIDVLDHQQPSKNDVIDKFKGDDVVAIAKVDNIQSSVSSDHQQPSENDVIDKFKGDDVVAISKVDNIQSPVSSELHESKPKTEVSSTSSSGTSQKNSLTIEVESNDDTKNMYTEFQEEEASPSSPVAQPPSSPIAQTPSSPIAQTPSSPIAQTPSSSVAQTIRKTSFQKKKSEKDLDSDPLIDIKKERKGSSSTKQESLKDDYEEEEYEVDFDEFLGDEDD